MVWLAFSVQKAGAVLAVWLGLAKNKSPPFSQLRVQAVQALKSQHRHLFRV